MWGCKKRSASAPECSGAGSGQAGKRRPAPRVRRSSVRGGRCANAGWGRCRRPCEGQEPRTRGRDVDGGDGKQGTGSRPGSLLRLVGGERSPEEQDVRLGRVHLKVLPSERLRDAESSPLLLVQDAQQAGVVLRKVPTASAGFAARIVRSYKPRSVCQRPRSSARLAAPCAGMVRRTVPFLCTRGLLEHCSHGGSKEAREQKSKPKRATGELGAICRDPAQLGQPVCVLQLPTITTTHCLGISFSIALGRITCRYS